MATILSDNQTKILDAISRDPVICGFFYLSGGTALAEYYLQHRLSEDLDFFSEEEFDPFVVSVFFKKHQKKLGIIKIDFQQSFNRNLFFLKLEDDIIKTEFTYYPFTRIESEKKINHLKIDSLIDLAVNKLFTIYQNPRSRDFIDLFFIINKTGWSIADLTKKAKIKFDFHIDPLQLGSKFIMVDELKDFPFMKEVIDHTIWQNFFIEEAKKMQRDIFV